MYLRVPLSLKKRSMYLPVPLSLKKIKAYESKTAFLIGQQNVNLSAVVRFPVDTNFKGVPSVVMQLAASDLI